jgi:hypothetical protein
MMKLNQNQMEFVFTFSMKNFHNEETLLPFSPNPFHPFASCLPSGPEWFLRHPEGAGNPD